MRDPDQQCFKPKAINHIFINVIFIFSQEKTKTKPGYTESVAGHSHIHTSGYSTDSQIKSCKFKDATKSKENNNDSGH